MAELLIEQWQLAVLRVRLDLSGRAAQVASELAAYPGGERRVLWSRADPLSAFGIPETSSGGPPAALTVPFVLRAEIAGALRRELDEPALWLRLVPPSGLLGAVPWEPAVAEAIGVPMLRVPDRLPAATDPGRAWTVAVVVNAEPGAGWAAEYVRGLTSALRARVFGDLEVDVFATAAAYRDLRDGPALAPWVRLHDPSRALSTHWERSSRMIDVADKYRTQRTTRTPSAGRLWTDWLAVALEGRAVRALHVVTDGILDGVRPLLALAPDPAAEEGRTRWAPVAGDEVRALADLVGASVLSFGSPPDNPADVATRLLADSSGIVRPGPTAYVALGADPTGIGLADAHAFLANPPGSTPLFRSPAVFAYLQPEHVAAALRDPFPAGGAPVEAYPDHGTAPGDDPWPALSARPPEEDVASSYGAAAQVPVWAAASERYLEGWAARLVREADPTAGGATTKTAYDRGVAQAVEEARRLVARRAKEG